MAKSFAGLGATIIDASADLPSSPVEGLMVFQKDTNELKIYDGSSWISMLDTDTPPGLVKIASGTLSGSGVNIVNCFSSDFTNYRMTVTDVAFSVSSDFYFQMLTNTTPVTSGTYYWAFTGVNSNGTGAGTSAVAQAQGYLGVSQGGGNGVFDILKPNLASTTHILCNGSSIYSGAYWSRVGLSAHDVSTAYNGIRLLSYAGVFNSGVYTMYGYKI